MQLKKLTSKLTLSDGLIVAGLLLALAPWMSGGRDALALLISTAGLAIAGIFSLRRFELKGATSSFLAVSIGAWLGWGALSQIWSVNRYQSQMWLLFMLLAALAAFITVIQPRLNQRYLVGGYLATAVAMTLAGLWLYFTGDYDRFTSTFYWANPAAAYLMPAVILASWWGITRRNLWLIAAAFITATGFWLTDSRGATLTLILVVAITAAVSVTLRHHWKGLLLIALLSFAAAWGLTQLKGNAAVTPGSRYAEAATGESTSSKDRLSYLQASFAIWWDQPLIGTGAGTFASVHPQYQQRPTDASTDPHNIYVQALAEQGIVGASLLAWVLLLIIVGVMNGAYRQPQRVPIAVAAIALLIHFGLDIDGRYPALLVLVAVLLALVYKPLLPTQPPRHARPVIMLLLLVTLGLAVANYQGAVARQNAEIHDYNGDYDKAAAANQQAAQTLIYDPDALNAAGIDYYVLATMGEDRQQNLNRARDFANQAAQRDPNDAQHLFLLGRVERLSGNLQQSQAAFVRALELDSYNHAEYYADLSSLQLNAQKDAAAAQATITRALALYTDEVIKNRSADTKMQPAVVQMLIFQARIQLGAGNAAAAKTTVERAKRLDPLNPFVQDLEQQINQAQPAA